MKQKKEPQAFEYLGKTFTPYLRVTGRNRWQRIADKVCYMGDHCPLLKEVNERYKWEDFYKAAKKAGCGTYDVFLLDGEQVIPCGVLNYYGKPSWYESWQKLRNAILQKN